MGYTVKYLCGKFNLSRSTLLYYESIGLLISSQRGQNKYRIYSDEDVKRMEQICIYRQFGISLDEIKNLLSAPDGIIKEVLERRLRLLNNDIISIKKQQHLILETLKSDELLNQLKIFSKESLMKVFELAGMDDEDLNRLHANLEERSSEGHQIFLETLGIEVEEIEKIREFARITNQNITNSEQGGKNVGI